MDSHRSVTSNYASKRRRRGSSSSANNSTRSNPTKSGFGGSYSSSRSISSAASRRGGGGGSVNSNGNNNNGRDRLRRRHNLGIANSNSNSSTSNNRRNNNNNNNNNNDTSSTTQHSLSPYPTSHIVCAIGENLARETCVVSLDVSAPFLLNVTKQSNGQSYSETISYLSVLCPDEVLMNEGRYHSPLARKVLQHFDLQRGAQHGGEDGSTAAATSKTATAVGSNNSDAAPCDEVTVVKFISRSYFDQTKGADLLRRLARQDTYDSTLVEEYILLSSSHAVLHYTQLTLGAVSFTKHCLDVRVNTGGHNNHRMEIDRSTLLQLELLTNNGAKSSSNRKHSLISTMDCTKTSVGHRLLRTTLMAPPCRMDTITARLNLVDTFLHDEDLFYATLQQLKNLTSLDNMLTNIVVVPARRQQKQQQQQQQQRQHSTDANTNSSVQAINTTTTTTNNSTATGKSIVGKSNAANARVASKGISALVCIKSTLASIPVLASILKNHLDRIDAITEEEKKRRKDSRKEEEEEVKDDDEGGEAASIATAKNSLLIGLGVGISSSSSSSSTSSSSSRTNNHQLLRAIIFALSQPELRIVRDAIDEAFTESTTYTKNANAMKHQECFALKSSDGNGMMDILRKAFLSNVDDIYKKADDYAEVHGISHVAVKFSTARGYYLSLPMEMASNLPNEFIQPTKSGKFIHCSTEEVQSLNIRAQDNIQDLLMMTHERIQEVLDVARSKYDALARLSDAVALLDLCHSFADKVTLSKLPWARPSLTDGAVAAVEDNQEKNHDNDGGNAVNADANATTNLEESYAIAICNGRYGIDVDDEVVTSGDGEWVANDTYANLSKNLTVISGINGSGKSTYLKQIAIIVLLAHCGSYVPAEEALIPLTNRLCARMMTADDQENNISSFMLEMKETAFICNNATSRSLILLDELGRATSNEDGVAIAWAVAECLLAKGALTYFVTHYPQLCQMSSAYPAVQNQHLKATMSDDGNGIIEYSHKIGTGPCDAMSSYGVEMATSCGWPSDVVEVARAIENALKDKLDDFPLCDEDIDIGTEIRYKKSLKETSQKLTQCVSECEPTLEALQHALQSLYVSMLETVPKSAITSLLKDENDENEDSTSMLKDGNDDDEG